ncbi:SPOR domain-containing protein [Methylomonas koyamae]|uniref:SPOR domain-containing protein n=1 Tax=Methylomonas koyamae TaxID=702114 RepID=UPI002872E57E|nr:SPOR domain-containing protein [Methylomonas koyamae]WNB75126.1 SPOR domain-containing protein [Methylomonas koyamae]
MAEPTGSKSKKTLDAFADDLDAMLNISEPAGREVGEIDDDEAIDRLLVGEETLGRDAEQEIDEFGDFDNLLEIDLPAGKNRPLDDIDEFGDEFDSEIADIPINPGREAEALADEFADAVGADIERELAADEVIAEVAELEQVGDIDEFAETEAETVVAAAVAAPAGGELENMAEIDEFGDEPEMLDGTADFLMADFDISADEDVAVPGVATADEIEADIGSPLAETDTIEAVAVDAEAEAGEAEPDAAARIVVEPEPDDDGDALAAGGAADLASVAVAEAVTAVAAPVPPPAPAVDYSGDITALNRQIAELKRQQQQLKHELAEKSEKAQLSECQAGLESLQVEQKKAKRGLDALSAKKPVAAYAAAGIAGVALLAGVGLGVQGMIAKSQVGELAAIIGKLQEQVNAAPANDAAEMAMLHKQLDELTVSTGVMSTQIAELSKAPHANAAATPSGDQAGKLAELANQNLQIGAALEALQNKVSALEKGRVTAVAAAPKPEKKKPAPVEENWAVNLVAFKQDWYAKSKAQEFAGKGVPAKVSKTETKGENWYRLSVDGFKTQYEAAAYAAKVKKTLNLDSVWVTRVKE